MKNTNELLHPEMVQLESDIHQDNPDFWNFFLPLLGNPEISQVRFCSDPEDRRFPFKSSSKPKPYSTGEETGKYTMGSHMGLPCIRTVSWGCPTYITVV